MKKEIDHKVLIKYSFSGCKPGYAIDLETYYIDIVQSLLDKNLISDLVINKESAPFGEEDKPYHIVELDKYVFSFRCKEKRDGELISFNFTLQFKCETHSENRILYVDIASNDYIFTLNCDSNCLEVLKHQLRNTIKGWTYRYCLLDEQSEFYAVQLYPRIYEVENFARYYINDVFVKVFGANWWNEAVANSIRKAREERIKDTTNYAGAYKDIQPHLLSLELNDLINIAKTKHVKWTPKYDSRIEQVLNNVSSADIKSLLKLQCETTVDVWGICFEKFLPSDFTSTYHLFEKRRNQIAHNKLLSYDTFEDTLRICEQLMEILKTAYIKFCEEFISEEEKTALNEYVLDLEEQKDAEKAALEDIAESESGVNVYSTEEILSMFDEVLFEIFSDVTQSFNDRNDLLFSEYFELPSFDDIDDDHLIFSAEYCITEETARFSVSFDLNDGQGETSEAIIKMITSDETKICSITFVNGEYSFNSYQSCYMPETNDELNETEVEEAKSEICNFIEQNFKNLKSEADLYNHLAAMGKTSAITESGVFCCECGEEYVCINEDFAEAGVCLNCGTRNKIIYCANGCGPVEAVCEDDFDDEKTYFCVYCEEKINGND